MFLGAGLYFLIKLRHRQPMLNPLGWVVPRTIHIVIALSLGVAFAAGIALYLRLRNQVTPPMPIAELLVLGFVLGPVLEESLFRGCILPVLAQTTGTIAAIIITAVMFALFHGPTDLVHWVMFTGTGIAYGWMRVASGSTTAPALMHANYNLALYLLTSN
jgi:membrane protease YdiL (CAAX protease family)